MGPGGHFTVVTLPAYKAEGTLERTIGALPAGTADHLLLVDDASPDGTVDVARRLGIDVRVHDRNRGYGANQKTCYREALDLGATVVVLLHPDYQYDPSAVPALVAPIVAGVADFTFGSRFACTGNPRAGGMPLYRYWGNRFSTVVENLLLGTHFTEMHSGMKAYSRHFLESVPFETLLGRLRLRHRDPGGRRGRGIPHPGGGHPHPVHPGVVLDQRAAGPWSTSSAASRSAGGPPAPGAASAGDRPRLARTDPVRAPAGPQGGPGTLHARPRGPASSLVQRDHGEPPRPSRVAAAASAPRPRGSPRGR